MGTLMNASEAELLNFYKESIKGMMMMRVRRRLGSMHLEHVCVWKNN